MWRVGGYVFIERLGERLGELLSYPFQAVFQGTAQPSVEDIEAYARARAEEFLGVIEDTASHRRADYGAVGQVVVVFATFSF
jgi:hypothetical protein